MVRLATVERLLFLFADVFQLPVSWSKQTSRFATFAWIHVGNTELEFWAATDNTDLPADCQPPLIHGMALDPGDLSSSIALLAEAGIECKSPRQYQTRNDQGELVTNFVSSVVLSLSSPSCCIFFCAWDPRGTIYPWPERLTAVERRARDRKAFDACDGGPLGLVGLSEIEIAASSIPEAEANWRAFTGSRSGPIAIRSCVAVTLTAGPRDMILSLTFEVRSLEQAKIFLSSRNLLGEATPGELVIALAATDGLTFKLREARPLQPATTACQVEPIR